jgi:hypothetical protein
MNDIKLHMKCETVGDGTYRLVLVISSLSSYEQMTRIALWVRESLRDSAHKIGIADPTASKLEMRPYEQTAEKPGPPKGWTPDRSWCGGQGGQDAE